MDASSVGDRIADISERMNQPWMEKEAPLKDLFQLLAATSHLLADGTKAPNGERPHTSRLQKIQHDIMRKAAGVPAKTTQDLLFKLAIWRWAQPSLNHTSPKDAVIYSAFRDLAGSLTDSSVLNNADRHDPT